MVNKIIKYKNKKEKVIRLRLVINGGIGMATQIAATPVIYGGEAKKILQESRTQPSKRAKENGRKLLELFSKITA